MLIRFGHKPNNLKVWEQIVYLMAKEYDLLDFSINVSHFMHGTHLTQTIEWLQRKHHLTVRILEFPLAYSMSVTVIELEDGPELTAFILKLT